MFGQVQSQSLGAGKPVGGQEGIAATAVAPRVAGDASALQRSQPRQGNPLWSIPLDTLRATRDRPLFSATRRPPPVVVAEAPKVSDPAPPPQPAPAPEKPPVLLVGVVHGPHLDLAILIDQTDKSLVRLRIGQSVRGWTVRGLDARTAMLGKAEQQVHLELPGRSTATVAAAAPLSDADLALVQ
jgi:general secretion pathway protein N